MMPRSSKIYTRCMKITNLGKYVHICNNTSIKMIKILKVFDFFGYSAPVCGPATQGSFSGGYLVIKDYNEHANLAIMEKISIKMCHYEPLCILGHST